MFDRIIKGGTVVDGSGGAPYTADVAVQDGRIVEVGRIAAPAREVMDADGLTVTPGWVDVHSHYDGQVTWDSQLAPSFWHGVTTTVMGNCGVGFAPVKADKRDWLINLMEGVEDIPGSALADGIKWEWETFPEYMDALDRKPLAFDVGTQLAHGPLRAYVMGERGAMNEPATPEDIAEMARLVTEAQACGSLGFSSSRTVVHRAMDGEPVPGTFAAREEIDALARAVGESGRGVLEMAPAGLLGEDLVAPPIELAWMNEISAKTGVPVTFLCGQNHVQPQWWREQLAECERHRSNRAHVMPQMFCRAIGIMVCLENKEHPFIHSETWKSLEHLPFDERVRRLTQDGALKRKMALEGVNDVLGGSSGFGQWGGTYALGTPADYEPDPKSSLRARAKREGRDPREVALDVMLEDGGHGFLHRPVMGYAEGDLKPHLRDAQEPGHHPRRGGRRGPRGPHLRRQRPDIHAHLLGARPQARPAPVAGAHRQEADGRHRALLRAARPRRAEGRHEGRHQRDRLRQPVLGASRTGARPALGRAPADAEGARLRGDLRGRPSDPRARRGHGGPPGPPDPRGPLRRGVSRRGA